MAKVKKSKRIWQISSAHLQRRVRQPPAAAVLPVLSKYVQFSEIVEPHPNEKTQHT